MNTLAGRGDDGVGLIELLISITLLGIGAVAILASYTGLIRLSVLNKEQTKTTNALTIAAEAVASPVVPYLACAGADQTTGVYRTAIDQALSQSANNAPVNYSVRYWNGTAFAAGEANCRDNDSHVPGYLRLQEITFSSTVATQSNAWTLTIVKRAA